MPASDHLIQQCLGLLARHKAYLVKHGNSVTMRRDRAEGVFLLGRKNRNRIAELLVRKFGTIETANKAIADRKSFLFPDVKRQFLSGS